MPITTALVTVNPKGQITIPAPIQEQLHLHSGDALALLVQDDRLVVTRHTTNIEAAFGLCKAKKSMSLEDYGMRDSSEGATR